MSNIFSGGVFKETDFKLLHNNSEVGKIKLKFAFEPNLGVGSNQPYQPIGGVISPGYNPNIPLVNNNLVNQSSTNRFTNNSFDNNPFGNNPYLQGNPLNVGNNNMGYVNSGFTGGNTGFTGGNTGFTGGNTGFTGGNTGFTGGNTGFPGGNTGFTGGNTGFPGGNTVFTGGNTGFTGGNTGFTGGNIGFNMDFQNSFWFKSLNYFKHTVFFRNNSTNAFYFNYNTNSWETIINNSNRFFPVFHRTTELPDSSFLVTGGELGGATIANVSHFINGQFVEKPNMIIARKAHGTAYLKGYVYVFGGYTDNGQILNSCERYDMNNGTWSQLAYMNYARGYATTCISGENHIFVIGGYGAFEVDGVFLY